MKSLEYDVKTGELTERELTAEEIAQMEAMQAEMEQVIVPEKISARQLRSALILKGIQLSTIDAVIDSLPDPQRSLAKVDWEYSTNFYRQNSMINQLAGAMQLTSEQVDDIFILGASLIND